MPTTTYVENDVSATTPSMLAAHPLDIAAMSGAPGVVDERAYQSLIRLRGQLRGLCGELEYLDLEPYSQRCYETIKATVADRIDPSVQGEFHSLVPAVQFSTGRELRVAARCFLGWLECYVDSIEVSRNIQQLLVSSVSNTLREEFPTSTDDTRHSIGLYL